jgi:hypothetical protein
MKKINNIRLASYKFVEKSEIMQENIPTEQVFNRRTRNNRNHNNQPITAEKCQPKNFIMRS